MKFTVEQIEQISALTARHTSQRVALACRQENERTEMEETQLAERQALGITVVPGGPGGPGGPAPAPPASMPARGAVRR